MLFHNDHMDSHVKILYKQAKAGDIESAYLLV